MMCRFGGEEDNQEVRILHCKFVNLPRGSVVLVGGFSEVYPPMG